jgi:hypothetical protein
MITKTMKLPQVLRSDCFAFQNTGKCSACKIMECRGCTFYKPRSDVKNAVRMEAFVKSLPTGHGNPPSRTSRTRKPVRIIFPDGSEKVFPSGIHAAAETGIRQELISRICRGKTPNSPGYQISFAKLA